jgi:iron complex outermembrane recepter protein
MGRIITGCLMLLLCNVALSQNKLTGKITDSKSGEPITGATVYIPELKTGTISDKDGVYALINLPKTRVVVQISFLGYKSVVVSVDLNSINTQDFKMEEAITEINEVVVTGTMRTTEITRSPVPIVTFSSRQLQQNLSTNIIDAISKLPGVSAVTTGPNISKPYIHGLGYNRVLTLFDGVRQEGQEWGDEHGIEVDENAVDRVEVIKGPASLTYGSDALAGVINLIPASPVPEGSIKGHAETSYQTNNGLIGLHTYLAGNKNGLIWEGVVTHKQATNYQNKNDGRVYGTAFNETDLSGYLGLNKKWGYSILNFSIFNDLQEIPDGSRDSLTRKFTKQITEADTYRPIVTPAELISYKITPLHQLVQHYRLYLSNNFILGKSKLAFIIGYQQNDRKEFSHPDSPHTPGLYLDLKTINYDLKYTVPESKGWETTMGVNGMYQINTNRGTEFIIPDYHQFDIGPFVLVTKAYNKLELNAGIRNDIRIFKNDPMFTRRDPVTGFDIQTAQSDTASANQPFFGFSHTFSGLSASIGASFNITKRLLIKSNIARGYRAPNISEISANGVHPGTLIYQIGNTGLKPEFSLQEDFGISYRWDHISGNIDLFNNLISNYIFNEKLLTDSGTDSVIVKGNQTFKYRQAKAMVYGWEVNLDVHPYDWLHFENSVSITYALNKGGRGVEINSNSKYLPFIPPLHTTSELRATMIRKTKHFSSFFFKIGMDYYAAQNRIYSANNTETPTPGYLLFSAGTGADILNRKGKVILSINILADNITDVAYQSHLSRLKYFEQYPDNQTGKRGIYNMGRNVSFKVNLPLNFNN